MNRYAVRTDYPEGAPVKAITLLGRDGNGMTYWRARWELRRRRRYPDAQYPDATVRLVAWEGRTGR